MGGAPITGRHDPLNITLIGCGRMGSALLRGWLESGISKKISIVEPQGLPHEFDAYVPDTISHYKDIAGLAAQRTGSDVYMIATKPQIMTDVCQALSKQLPPKALVISIAAGQSLSTLESRLEKNLPAVRAMPNTPAAIGKGITVAIANKSVSATQKQQAEILLKAGGAVAWVDDESLMDAVTALSGSGPAYVFLLIETMAKAGEEAGLPAALSMMLARQTVIGSAALAETEGGTSAENLRHSVTSPGGTTEAALKILLQESGLQSLMTQAIANATARGRELGKA